MFNVDAFKNILNYIKKVVFRLQIKYGRLITKVVDLKSLY